MALVIVIRPLTAFDENDRRHFYHRAPHMHMHPTCLRIHGTLQMMVQGLLRAFFNIKSTLAYPIQRDHEATKFKLPYATFSRTRACDSDESLQLQLIMSSRSG